jgi:hypothetical protein
MRSGLIAALAGALTLGGCGGLTAFDSEPAAPTAPALLPSSYPVAGLVGSWGVASFRAEKDRVRTRAQAKAQCKQPYVITKGPTDGVMMHVADDPKLYELTLKGSPDGKTYLGFNAPPGDVSDREILSFSDKEIVMRFVDADANTRYGTFIYVRC